MPKTRIDYIYAEEDGRGGITWALGPEDFEMVRQGYACGHCLETFLVGGALIQMPVCPTCKRKTALMGVEEVVEETPTDWVDYEKERAAALKGET